MENDIDCELQKMKESSLKESDNPGIIGAPMENPLWSVSYVANEANNASSDAIDDSWEARRPKYAERQYIEESIYHIKNAHKISKKGFMQLLCLESSMAEDLVMGNISKNNFTLEHLRLIMKTLREKLNEYRW